MPTIPTDIIPAHYIIQYCWRRSRELPEVDSIGHEPVTASHSCQQTADGRSLMEEQSYSQSHSPAQRRKDSHVEDGLVEDVIDLALPLVQLQILGEVESFSHT